MKRVNFILLGFLLFTGIIASPKPLLALSVPLTLTTDGTAVGSTLVFKADLTGTSGLTEIGSITLQDDGTPVGGYPGIFSGFDVDAVFIDIDGNLDNSGDRYFFTSYSFAAGTTRPITDPYLPADYSPNSSHPGPTFGSINANTIDLATATLNDLDGVGHTVTTAAGFLTLGDGGTLTINFSPKVPVEGTLFLFVGEVGGQVGEGLGASVTVSDVVVPIPPSVLLLGSGLLGLIGIGRFRGKK
jgi:hypothetical protein